MNKKRYEEILKQPVSGRFIKMETEEMNERRDWEDWQKRQDQFIDETKTNLDKLTTHLFGLNWQNGKIGQILQGLNEVKKTLEDYMKVGTENHYMMEKRVSSLENKIKTMGAVSENERTLKAKFYQRLAWTFTAVLMSISAIVGVVTLILRVG